MIRATLLLLFWLGCFEPACATGLSAATNGICLAVAGFDANSGVRTNEVILFDQRLLLKAFCSTGAVELNYPRDPSYGVKIKMLSPDGKEAVKTSQGRKFGSKFDRLKSYSDTQMFPESADEAYEKNPNLGGAGIFLPAPMELFQMKKPGIYSLEIEMQMFRLNRETNPWSRTLFLFPPVRIKVQKPSDS